jgi:hypothetical protein
MEETLITQREAAERITDTWGIPMHESKLSVLISAGVGPLAHSKRGSSTMYEVADVDAWAAGQLRKTRAELMAQVDELDAILAVMGQ